MIAKVYTSDLEEMCQKLEARGLTVSRNFIRCNEGQFGIITEISCDYDALNAYMELNYDGVTFELYQSSFEHSQDSVQFYTGVLVVVPAAIRKIQVTRLNHSFRNIKGFKTEHYCPVFSVKEQYYFFLLEGQKKRQYPRIEWHVGSVQHNEDRNTCYLNYRLYQSPEVYSLMRDRIR